MSEIKYGLISKVDSECLEKTIDLICDEFKGFLTDINITEIGLYNCETAKGIREYCLTKYRDVNYTGIDSEKDMPITNNPTWMNFIKGNSGEVYNQLEDNSQHLIFVDGCHCFAHVISDFYCYADKVKIGGYLAFHDTGKHIKPFKDFQHGDRDNPDAYISVRKALQRVGLLKMRGGIVYNYNEIQFTGLEDWLLVSDEADINDEAGGVCIFKKLY